MSEIRPEKNLESVVCILILDLGNGAFLVFKNSLFRMILTHCHMTWHLQKCN